MKAPIFIAISLDGFIARNNGELDWLEGLPTVDGEDYGFEKFMNSVDTLVMGRNTFDMVSSFGEWPYGKKSVVVLTSRSINIPDSIAMYVEAMACSPAELVANLSQRKAKHIYVDGGKTIQGFLEAGLIQHLIISRIPILIGEGIPLFGPLKHDITLQHIETRVFPNGLEQSEYEIAA